MSTTIKKPLKGSTLNLSYAFVSDPNPIIASEAGQTPNQVNLTIVISNPHSSSISIDKIEITIPVGEETARDLSTEPSLPSPTYDDNKSWYIDTEGSIITIASNTEDPLVIEGQSIKFKLNNISVNDIEGIVPITITEYLTDQLKTTDANAYSLTKLETTYPITNFYAQPEVFYRNGQATTLYWDCSEYGQDFNYRVHSDSWRPTTVYTANDGKIGVQTPALYQTTTFALDILKADTIQSTLYTTVPVVVPAFYNTYYSAKTGGIERLVTIYWTAVNASSCEIQLNGETYITNAPLDTNPEGYPLFIDGTDPNAEFFQADITVIAYSEDANGQARYQFSVFIKSTTQYSMNYPTPSIHTSALSTSFSTYSIAITPNNTFALVVGVRADNTSNSSAITYTPFLNKINLSDFSCQAIQLNEGNVYLRATNVAIINDTAYTPLSIWYVYPHNPTAAFGYIKKISLNDNSVSSYSSILGDVGISWVGQGNFLVSARSPDTTVPGIDVSQAIPGIVSINADALSNTPVQLQLDEQGCCHTSVTPNGQLALVTNMSSNSVSIIDITQIANGILTLVTTLDVKAQPTATAITSDGKLALVANSGSGEISVINLDTLTVEPNTIKVGSTPYGIAIVEWQGIAYAYVANKGNNRINLVNIPMRSCMNGGLTIKNNPVAVSVFNKNQILIIQENSVALTSMWI